MPRKRSWQKTQQQYYLVLLVLTAAVDAPAKIIGVIRYNRPSKEEAAHIMPPPPPPSASYNLVIEDSSSESEDENYYRRQNQYMTMVTAGGGGGGGGAAASSCSPSTALRQYGLLSHDHDHDSNARFDNNFNIDTAAKCSPKILLLPPQDEMEEVDDNKIISMKVDENQYGQNEDEMMGETTADAETRKKKRKKKKKKKKKKSKKSSNANSLDDEEEEDEDDDADQLSEAEAVVEAAAGIETTTDPSSIATSSSTEDVSATTHAKIEHQIPKKSSPTSKSISFGTVSVEHYARTLGTHVVPLDGGWPLGLSNRVVVSTTTTGFGRATTKNDHEMEVVVVGGGNTGNNQCNTPSSSPTQQRNHRGRNNSAQKNMALSNLSSPLSTASSNGIHSPTTPSSSLPTSTSSPHFHRSSPTNSLFTIDDFEARKQIELQQRYIQLIRNHRRRKFEKEWERKHMNKNFHHHNNNNTSHHHNTRRNNNAAKGRYSGSFGTGGGGGGGKSSGGRNRSSGSYKMEMSPEDKAELERLSNQPITMPTGELETRPFDYKKKICHVLKQHKGSSGSSTSSNKDCHLGDKIDHIVTEEEEMYHEQGGRNPLFATLSEDARRKILLRDDHLMNICQHVSNDNANNNNNTMMNDHESNPLDPTDTAITQHIQHELETLRIQRSDPANLGCSCRKLHVFLPGSIDKSHHKKKGSHRRMPERKVCEELRRRGLLNKSNENMSREKMEILLHDTIENEPCCWGNDCPCVKNGIGCQADTCSCWLASHDVAHGGANNNPHLTSAIHGQAVEVMKSRCGNVNGMYIVNFEEIAKYRKQYVAKNAVEEK